jgi:hypothetical protein
MVSTTCGSEELDALLAEAALPGRAVVSGNSLFLHRHGRWYVFMDHDQSGTWRHLICAPEDEMRRRVRRGTPRAAAVPAGLEQRVLATAGEYLALHRTGAVQLFAGATSDQIHSPESEDAFLRMCAYLIEKGTGQYWLRFVR